MHLDWSIHEVDMTKSFAGTSEPVDMRCCTIPEFSFLRSAKSSGRQQSLPYSTITIFFWVTATRTDLEHEWEIVKRLDCERQIVRRKGTSQRHRSGLLIREDRKGPGR